MVQPSATLNPAGSALQHFGAELRHWRARRSLSQAELGSRMHCSGNLVGKVERAERSCDRSFADRADAVLGTGGALGRLWPLVAAEVARARPGVAGAHVQLDDDMNRRALLSALGSLAAAPVAVRLDDLAGALSRSATDQPDLDEWERTAQAYAHDVGFADPARLLPNLLGDLQQVREVMDRTPDSARPRLRHVAGQLAAWTAMTLVNAGDPSTARRWWRTARELVDASGDTALATYVRGRQAVLGLYGGYTPEQILDIAADAQAHAGAAATAGLASAQAAQAQVLSVMGLAIDADAALHRLCDTFDALQDAVASDRSSQYGWSAQKLHHVTSYVNTRLGRTRTAMAAQAAALASYPGRSFQGPAQVQLHHAACLIMDGYVEDGIGHATQVLAALPPARRRDGLVQGAAHTVWARLPAGTGGSDVVAYQELLTPGASPS
ncbi:MAG: helix-turn-helix domain-containing protein [Sporichthyaceae bacterium]|nr:helix-turn-helix domain-containing protein [Sporichthyaceae bacterium]